MNLSRKSRYGITALVDLAMYAGGQCVQLNSIAKRNGISVKYLEQIFSSLRRAGMVRSVKGPQGGYLLARPPKEVDMASVVKVLEGNYFLENEENSGKEDERGISTAIQKLLIDPVNEQMDRLLQKRTLQDLVDFSLQCNKFQQEMYYI